MTAWQDAELEVGFTLTVNLLISVDEKVSSKTSEWLKEQNLWWVTFNSFLASGNFCSLLITFANSLDSDQDRQNVVPNQVPNHLDIDIEDLFYVEYTYNK